MGGWVSGYLFVLHFVARLCFTRPLHRLDHKGLVAKSRLLADSWVPRHCNSWAPEWSLGTSVWVDVSRRKSFGPRPQLGSQIYMFRSQACRSLGAFSIPSTPQQRSLAVLSDVVFNEFAHTILSLGFVLVVLRSFETVSPERAPRRLRVGTIRDICFRLRLVL